MKQCRKRFVGTSRVGGHRKRWPRPIVPRLLLAVALLLVCSPGALAKNCRIVTVQPISFGSYDPMLSGNLDTTGTLSIRCSNNTNNVSIKLDAGMGGSFNPRTMQGPADQLAYNLYTDASRVTVWGDGTSGTDFVLFPVLSHTVSVPIYARTPPGQSVGVGAYADTVVVTVEW